MVFFCLLEPKLLIPAAAKSFPFPSPFPLANPACSHEPSGARPHPRTLRCPSAPTNPPVPVRSHEPSLSLSLSLSLYTMYHFFVTFIFSIFIEYIMYIHIYRTYSIYIYIKRDKKVVHGIEGEGERERERERERVRGSGRAPEGSWVRKGT